MKKIIEKFENEGRQYIDDYIGESSLYWTNRDLCYEYAINNMIDKIFDLESDSVIEYIYELAYNYINYLESPSSRNTEETFYDGYDIENGSVIYKIDDDDIFRYLNDNIDDDIWDSEHQQSIFNSIVDDLVFRFLDLYTEELTYHEYNYIYDKTLKNLYEIASEEDAQIFIRSKQYECYSDDE